MLCVSLTTLCCCSAFSTFDSSRKTAANGRREMRTQDSDVQAGVIAEIGETQQFIRMSVYLD